MASLSVIGPTFRSRAMAGRDVGGVHLLHEQRNGEDERGKTMQGGNPANSRLVNDDETRGYSRINYDGRKTDRTEIVRLPYFSVKIR
jgi:hypothetical protein